MLSDEYHAPAAVGGHVRIYSATELKAKLRAAGLQLGRQPPRPRPALAVLVAEVRGRRRPTTTTRSCVATGAFLEWDIIEQPRSTRLAERVLSPVLGKSLVLYAARSRRQRPSSSRSRDPGDRHDPAARPARRPERRGCGRPPTTSRRCRSPSRDDPVVPRRPLRPVEPRRVGDGPRRRRPARRGRGRLRVAGRRAARPTAAGTTTTGRTAASRRPSSTPTCAPTSPPASGTTGAARGTAASSTTCGRRVERALDFVLSLRRADGLALWAIEADGTRPWDYALLTGTSTIQHALRCGGARSPTSSPSRARLGRRRRRDGRRRRRPPRRLRAEGPLGDGLVLPGAHRRPHRARPPSAASPRAGTRSPWRARASAASPTSRG